MDIFISLSWCVIGLLLSYYSIIRVRSEFPEDIRIVWYFFSLTIVISSMVGFWAVNVGAINDSGGFVGESGGFLNKLIMAAVDIKLSLTIVFAIVVLILVPQLLSYVLSGIFGIAKSPVYFFESLSFLTWSMIKTFVVTSGVLFVILIFGVCMGWQSFDGKAVISWFVLAISFCFLSFFVLLLYRCTGEVVSDVQKFTPAFILNILGNIHSCFTRRM